MLEVLPIQTKTEQAEICARAGVVFKENDMAYRALVDGELTAVCQFCMDAEGGHIHDLAMVKDRPFTDRDRIESLFVMGRAAMNFIDLCGVHYAIYRGEVKDEQTERLVKAVGFKLTDRGTYEVNLEGFFTDHCHKD